MFTEESAASTPEVFAQRGVADIEGLATAEGDQGLRIDVEQCGDLDDLRPSVGAALYRVAQESITNAKRHARHATRVHVLVGGGTDTVRLSVSDDGERGLSNSRVPGYGLVGMAERVTLLGGKAGARGFLLKDAGPDLLVQAIHAAAEGDALIAPGVTARLLATFAGSTSASAPSSSTSRAS